MYLSIFCFKQKTAYELRISDWSSDVCSSDLSGLPGDRSEEVGRAIVISCLRVAFGPAAELPSDALASRPIIPTNCDNHGDGPPPQRGPAGLLVSTAIGGPTPSARGAPLSPCRG